MEKIGKRVGEFLRGRKFRVVANGHMSVEADAVCRVPRGTVLAAAWFEIMISDTDVVNGNRFEIIFFAREKGASYEFFGGNSMMVL